jgi:hypothetical protein
MTDLKIRVGITPDDLIPGYQQDLLSRVGIDTDWYINWTLRHWDAASNTRTSLEMFDITFNSLVEMLDDELDESQYQRQYALIEEHTDELVGISSNIQQRLAPFIGHMPNGHPARNLMGIDFDYVGKDSMDIIFSLE